MKPPPGSVVAGLNGVRGLREGLVDVGSRGMVGRPERENRD